MNKSVFSVSRHSWVSLAACWFTWVIMAYDKEVLFRLGPVLSTEFDLSAAGWGLFATFITLSLALMGVPGSVLSDRYGSGSKRAKFQLPLVIGYTLISFLSGIKLISEKFAAFIVLRFFSAVGQGWSEPVGVSNTAEWWPKEHRGFALGVHHAGYPVGVLLSGLAVSWIISTYGVENWRYALYLGLFLAVPVMLFWVLYSTEKRYKEFCLDCLEKNLTLPLEDIHLQKSEPGMFRKTVKSKGIMLTALSTMITHVVYIGMNTILPAYLFNIMGYDLAKAAGLSTVFTLTGILGQIFWPTLSDKIGRKTTLIICGLWMSASIASFYFASSETSIIILQLVFGIVANAIWPIFYAVASDYARPGGISTANGIITTAMFIGGGIAPLVTGLIINSSGGWKSIDGYHYSFFFMAACALIGVFLQLALKKKEKLELELNN